MREAQPHPKWKDIALVGAFWNCESRAQFLLTEMRPWFDRIVIAVQESEDNTLEVVRGIADEAIPDKWHGHGNISFQKAIAAAKTPWCFLISDDELPSITLLGHMQSMLNEAQQRKFDGWWIHFRSFIDGYEFTREQDNHLRLWKSTWPWPPTIHSRPMIPMEKTGFWPDQKGYISHERTLDEMMLDYIRRYDIGRGNAQWEAHNKRMMLSACQAIAERRGAEYVTSFPWWGQVSEITGVSELGGSDRA